MYLGLAQEPFMGRHVSGSSLGHCLDDIRLGTAEQPDIVSKVGSAEQLIAFTVGTMTYGAVGAEDRFPLGRYLVICFVA